MGGAVNVVNGRLTRVEQNDLSGGAGDAIVLGVTSSVTGGIFNNNLATTGLGIRNNGAGLVNASGNWWGTLDRRGRPRSAATSITRRG